MIKTVVTEARDVAASIAQVKKFLYDHVSAINTLRDIDASYPAILLECTPSQERGQVNNSYLPRKKSYTFRIFCYDTYHQDESKTKSLEEKQEEVESLLDIYVAEWMRRTQTDSTKGHMVKLSGTSVNGFLAKDVHNDKLIQASYNLQIILDNVCVIAPPPSGGCNLVYVDGLYWDCNYSV